MSPTLVPVVNARSTVLRHVKRAESHTDTSVVVLAVISVVILTVTLLFVARYFCRARRRNSPSSTDSSGQSSSHWYSPRCFGSLRTGRTVTPSHQDPFLALPPRDPASSIQYEALTPPEICLAGTVQRSVRYHGVGYWDKTAKCVMNTADPSPSAGLLKYHCSGYGGIFDPPCQTSDRFKPQALGEPVYMISVMHLEEAL
ncbi:hypothetical protein BKA82DRAFT_4341733 [Pisolithus tinctorius]|nr:hypothetical protein BKA82DRAFT_4341733 [Pisolithus tinctorius]